MRNLSNLLVSI